MGQFYKHPNALVESENVGEGTRIWAFAHVLPKAVVGRDCNLCDNVFIENDVIIGDRVTIKCGVQVWDGTRIEDDVFIGPNATLTNDRFPRSKHYPEAFAVTTLRKGSSIGANATLLPGIYVGQYSMVGAGAVVTRSVPPYAVVAGNPARIIRYVDAGSAPPPPDASNPADQRVPRVSGVRLISAPVIRDLRGSLTYREIGGGLPFQPARFFAVLDVPSREVRGEHAHRRCEQLLVCLHGSAKVLCDDGEHREEFLLDSPSVGLYLPPMVWGVQYSHSVDSVLGVFASHPYDPADYIRDYEVFLRERRTMAR